MLKTIGYLTPQYFSDESYIGGGERYPLNLAIGLAESSPDEFRVRILSFGKREFHQTLHPGVELHVMPVGYSPRNGLDQLSWAMVSKLADVDVVHFMQCFTRTAEIGCLISKLLRKPTCATDLGGTSSTINHEYSGLNLVDRIVCYSDFGASLIKTTQPIYMVKGGVDTRQFSPPLRRPKRDRVLYVGRLLPHKGIDQLIEALPTDLPLTCCGRPYHKPYFEYLQTLAQGKRVEFVTDASDAAIRELYLKAWVNVLPSTYRDYYGQTYVAPELMGLTLLESMASGTPVISSRVGAMPEFIHHGVTGFVYDTPEELTGYIRKLSAEPDLVEQMGFRAKLLAENEFDMRVCGGKLANLYRELIA
ncbi:MAG: glycosyltransferase family 4 protein [Fimbriiglobus sp.]